MSKDEGSQSDKQQPEAVYVWWSEMEQQWRIRKWDMAPFVEGTKYVRVDLSAAQSAGVECKPVAWIMKNDDLREITIAESDLRQRQPEWVQKLWADATPLYSTPPSASATIILAQKLNEFDAARYRFIRSEASHEIDGVWAKISDNGCNGEKMDAAIDAAMAKYEATKNVPDSRGVK